MKQSSMNIDDIFENIINVRKKSHYPCISQYNALKSNDW